MTVMEIYMDKNLKLAREKLAHDLRSNLNVVLGYAEMLKDELGDRAGTSTLEDLDCIITAGKELLDLGGRVDDLYNLHQGKWPICSDPVPGIIAGVVREIERVFPVSRITVDGDIEVKTSDQRAMTKLLGFLLHCILRVEKGDAHVAISVDGDEITFSVEGWDGNVEQKLGHVLRPVDEMKDIKDFDAYYLNTLSGRAAVSIEPLRSGLVCTLS